MEPQQPQQPSWADLAGVPEWLTIGRHPVPNGSFPALATMYQQVPSSFHAGMASNTQFLPGSPSGVMPSQPGMASRRDTQAVPPHPTPHHATFPAPARALAAAATLPTMPYGQQPTANRLAPPPRPWPGVRNVLQMPVQRRQQQLAQAPIVPSQAPATRAGAAAPLYHGQPHRAPQAHFAQPTHMQPRPTRAQQVKPTYAPPPGPPPNWQGPAQTRYAPPPGPPPGWNATPPPPPPRAPSVQVPQHQTRLASSREQTASPWSAAVFTPSPVVSTAATTPSLALTPSPAVGGPVPLPDRAQVAPSATPQIPSSGQRVVREHEQTAVPAQIIRPTLKRRIADADVGACKPGPSKRPATDASVQARSSETGTIGRQVQLHNTTLPSQHAPASPQRDAAPAPVISEPVTSSAESEKEDAPAVADDDAGSLFGDNDCIDEDDATLAMELALALGQDDAPAVASDDADPLCEDGDSIDDAELARELALALGEPDDIPAVASAGAEDGDSIGDDAELARELALALGEDDAACAAANDDGSECPAHAAQLSLPLGLAEAGRKEGAGAIAVKATSAPLPGSAGGASTSATTREPAAAIFALCLPGTDPVPEGSVGRVGPPAHLLPVTPAPMAPGPSGGSRGKGKKAVKATPPHPNASNGATSSASPGEAAEPPTAPGNRGKGGARKKSTRTARPSAAAGPSTTAAAITHAAAVEKSVKRSKAMAAQNPDVFKTYSWIQGSSSASGSGPASTSFAAAAPVPAQPLFTRSPPPPGPVPKGGRRDAVKGRRCPTSEPMPKDRPFWCKMCWEDRVKTTYWYDYNSLRRHVREKHEDLLDSDIWKHAGM